MSASAPEDGGGLDLPELTRASAPFELLPVRELLGRTDGTEWISARAFVREELTRHNGDNRTKVELRSLVLHPAAAAEMRAVREQILTPIPSKRQRMYTGYEIEGTLAWGLVDLECLSSSPWPYAHPRLSWQLVAGPANTIGSAYAVVYTEHEGTRRLLAWRRHELMSCVDPERFGAQLVAEAAFRLTPSEHASYEWQREPERFATVQAARASQAAKEIAALCRAGRAAVLADPHRALRLSTQMGKMGDLVEGVSGQGIWTHPCAELAALTLARATTQVRACVSETISLRAHFGTGGLDRVRRDG